MPRITNIQQRGGTAAQWNSANPVLAAREIGVETDTGLLKIGDGVKNWKALGYYNGKPFDMAEVSDDVAVEMAFDVNTISAPLGVRMNVPTHISNPGQTTHPSVLFFPDGWGSPVKWKYWMAHTPYPGGNDDHEDPSIAVSNNGISWQVPAGVTNPLADATGQPEYHSDVDLKMGPDGTMYMFYRWAASVDNGGTEEQFRYMSTKDGVNWTAPVMFHVLDQDVARIMSPSLIFEDGRWTMWGVDIFSSPNKIVRKKSVGASIPLVMSDWGAVEYPTIGALPAGKEPWHIFMIKHGGKYFGLLNTCDLDQNGANGELHFMQSYDGYTFETSPKTVVPMFQAGEHDQIYRSTMIPAVQDGVHGFRLFYTGWQDAGPVWNVYRSFLSCGSAGGGSGPVTTDTMLDPSTVWDNSGNFSLSVSGKKATIEFDLTFARAAGSPVLPINNAFVSLGVVVPMSMRVNTNTITRYYSTWVTGAGFNLPVQIAINFYTGEALIRQQSGTATNLAAGTIWQVSGDLIVDSSLISTPTPTPTPVDNSSLNSAVLVSGTGDRAAILPTLTGHASMLTDPTNRLAGADGSKFFTLFDARGRIANPLDNYYGYTSGHNSTQIWLVTAPTPAGPWTWRQAVRTLGTQVPLLNNNHLSSPDVLWYNNQVYLYYHGSKPVANGIGQATALATSTDGVNFTEKPALALNCVYESDKTRYYAVSTTYCRMVDAGGYLACVFQANTNLVNDQAAGSSPTSVGYATSVDGVTWQISPVPLMVADIGTSGPFGPALARIGGMWWLTAYVPADNKVNLYISDRLEPGTFRKQGAWFAPPPGFDWVDSPFIKYLDGQWHLWYGATDSTYTKYGETFHAVLNWSI